MNCIFRNIIFILLMLLLTISCSENKYEKFVSKYYNENFEDFLNLGITVRGFDNDNDPIVSVSQLNTDSIDVCMITIERKNGNIKGTNYSLLRNINLIDTQKINSLASRFLKYDVYQVKVNNSKDVFVKLFNDANEFLVRVSNQSGVNKKCEIVRGNWYKCQ